MNNRLHRLAERVLILSLVIAPVLAFKSTAGTINFGNDSSSKIIDGQTGLPVAAAQGARVAIYWAPIGSGTFVQLGSPVAVGVPLAGLFAAGTRTTGLATPGGSKAHFQLRAWSGPFTTFEEALATPGVPVGQSQVVEVLTGNPDGDPPMPPGPLAAGGLQAFTLSTNRSQPIDLICATNKVAACDGNWEFDGPSYEPGCSVVVTVLSTVTNLDCPRLITRTWVATDACGHTATCSQSITLICPDCLSMTPKVNGTELELSWLSKPNLLYKVQYRTNLFTGSWIDVGPPVNGNGTLKTVHDASFNADPQRFYRLVWLGN